MDSTDTNFKTSESQTAALLAFKNALVSLNNEGLIQPPIQKAIGEAFSVYVTPVAPVKKPSNRKSKIKAAPEKAADFISWFITSAEDQLYSVRRGGWECVVSQDPKVAHILKFNSAIKNRSSGTYIVCIRPVGSKVTIFNASNITYGTTNSAQKMPQVVAETAGALPVPFVTLTQKKGERVGSWQTAKADGPITDLSTLKVIAWDGAQDMLLPPVGSNRWSTTVELVNRHFAGAAVVSAEGKSFLFDTDRNELKFGNFNPFFARLPRAVKSVAEAYRVLSPKDVTLRTGWQRQGEFFFDPVTTEEVSRIAQLATGDVPTRQLLFTQVGDAADVLGSIYYALIMGNRIHEMEVYIQKCIDHNNGFINGSDKVYAKSAVGNIIQNIRDTLPRGIKSIIDVFAWTKPSDKAINISDITGESPNGNYSYSAPLRRLSPNSPPADALAAVGWSNSNVYVNLDKFIEVTKTAGVPSAQLSAMVTFLETHTARAPVDRSRDNQVSNQNSLINTFNRALVGQTTDANNRMRGNAHMPLLAVLNPENNKEAYVRGVVVHSGREHHPVLLRGWHRVHSNTASANWTVAGNVD